jgi:hypothetical protein
MWWDFNLRQHGDPYEKLWWPLLEHEFQEYEPFWNSHIVPLTNRIDPGICETDRQWISLREDPSIDQTVEQMAMSQYSTFYFLSRASSIILFEPHVYIEDAVLFLDLSVSNLIGFVKSSSKVFAKLGIPPDDLRLDDNSDVRRAIRRYRNAFSHAPRIGRAHHVPPEYIPKSEYIPEHNGQDRHSWRSIQGLQADCFVEARPMFHNLRRDLLVEIKKIWRSVQRGLDQSKIDSAAVYRRLYNLDEDWCIPGKKHVHGPARNA